MHMLNSFDRSLQITTNQRSERRDAFRFATSEREVKLFYFFVIYVLRYTRGQLKSHRRRPWPMQRRDSALAGSGSISNTR